MLFLAFCSVCSSFYLFTYDIVRSTSDSCSVSYKSAFIVVWLIFVLTFSCWLITFCKLFVFTGPEGDHGVEASYWPCGTKQTEKVD